jgi:hypothetical protein
MVSFSAALCLHSQRDAGTTIVTYVSRQIFYNLKKSFYRRYDRHVVMGGARYPVDTRVTTVTVS